MGRGARLLRQLRPYTLLFVANIGATLAASVLDGVTFVLVIPFLRAMFGRAALPVEGGSVVERMLAVVAGPLLSAGSPQVTLRNVVLEFPSYEHALSYATSPEYAEAKALRQGAGLIDITIVEGV